jgi:hypothetical protein
MPTKEQLALKTKILENDALREQRLDDIHKQMQSLAKEERSVRDSIYEDYARLGKINTSISQEEQDGWDRDDI